MGTKAALALLAAKPEEWRIAKEWVLLDPDKKTHRVKNLKWWLRDRLGPVEGKRLYDGLAQVVRCLKGTRKGRPVSQARGWRLLALPRPINQRKSASKSARKRGDKVQSLRRR